MRLILLGLRTRRLITLGLGFRTATRLRSVCVSDSANSATLALSIQSATLALATHSATIADSVGCPA